MKRFVWSILACIFVASPLLAAAPVYRLAHKYVLGGDGGWDYLTYDRESKRLFISRSVHVMVVDPSNGKVTGDIPDTGGVHGIALAHDLAKGFTSNGRDNSVTVFSLPSLRVSTTIVVPAQTPDAILYEPVSKRVVTFNGRSDDATFIDAKTNAVLTTIPLGGKPEFAVADGTGKIYVNIEDASEQVALDARALKVLKKWKLPGCEDPTGLAMDRRAHRLFAGCSNSVMAVTNSDTGSPIATVPIGKGTDAIEFSPARRLIFSSNGADGTLTVIHEDAPDKYSILENASTQTGARTLALDSATENIYLVTADFDLATPPPDATPLPNGQPARPRRVIRPGTFTLLVMSPTSGH